MKLDDNLMKKYWITTFFEMSNNDKKRVYKKTIKNAEIAIRNLLYFYRKEHIEQEKVYVQPRYEVKLREYVKK